ncbi:MAG: hypothetical protein ACRC4Y_01455 [Cetobacterium sp.]
MAGVKGQKSGGFGGRKNKDEKDVRNITVSFRVNEEEKKIIDEFKGNKSLVNAILDLIKNK